MRGRDVSWLATLSFSALACHPGELGPQTQTKATAPTLSVANPTAAEFPPTDTAPPHARRSDAFDIVHGVRVDDPYRDLEDATSPSTRAWLSDFDRYTRRTLGSLPNRESLAARLTELSYVEWVAPPRRHGARTFWSRQHKDKEKPVWYWREGQAGEPKVLLDPNTLSKDGSVALHGVFPSLDGRYAAYKLSSNNKDEATLHVMDVGTGQDSVIDTITGAKYAHPSWAPDGSGFYYVGLPTDPTIPVDQLPGHAAVFFHALGTAPSSDVRVYDKTGDARTFLGVDVSRDGHFLTVEVLHGWTKNDLYVKDLRGKAGFRPLVVGKEAHFAATVWKDRAYVRTDLGAPRYRVMVADPARSKGPEDWKVLVAEEPAAVLESADIVGGHLALKYLENASSRLAVTDLAGKVVQRITTPSIGTLSALVGNPEDDTAYYSYESFLEPANVFETSVTRGGRTPFYEVKVPVDASPYLVEQVFYPSKDGTRVSMFIVRRKDLPKDGSTPFLLTGYGGFQIAKVPAFTGSLFAWLERGGGYALPNLRGGGEYGEDWHRAGMRDKKQNVFDDFIAAASWLEANGYTRRDRLAVSGGSNGGLLVGAAMTQRPDLFRAVVCSVPLLDMVRYHRFGSGRTWISEYGSAEDAKEFASLYAYSPYHHVVDHTAYPSLLMLTADSDDRVDPMHARKFAARVLDAKSNDARVLVRVETNAGHGGGDMIKKNVERGVDLYSFLFAELGMNR